MIPGMERYLGGGHGNPLQYSCLENPHGQRSLAGYSAWECKWLDATEETQLVKKLPAMQDILVQFLGWEDHLEKE